MTKVSREDLRLIKLNFENIFFFKLVGSRDRYGSGLD